MRAKVGLGIDAHNFAEGRPLMLGGVRIDYPRGLEGHSDADVLIHAIADALLGACGLQDIGHYFPDTDDQFKDMPGSRLLSHVAQLVAGEGCRIANVDAVLVLEEPRIAPWREQIHTSLAGIMGISPDQVGVRGTTMEGMGFTGRGEGIMAQAVALVECETVKPLDL